MKPVQHTIYNLAPFLNPAGVEAHIRHSRRIMAAGSTIDHLSEEELREGAEGAAAMEQAEPGYLHSLAHSVGLGRDHDMWNDITFRIEAAQRRRELSLPNP